MLLARQILSIATTISAMVILIGPAFPKQINGDCNIINSGQQVSGNVVYEIHCNNIDIQTQNNITELLEVIESLLQSSTSVNDIQETLDAMVSLYRQSIERDRMSRSPRAELRLDWFLSCDVAYDELTEGCYDDLEVINTGGRIERVESFQYLDMVEVILFLGNSECGWSSSVLPQQQYHSFDYSSLLSPSYARDSEVNTGEVIASFQAPLMYRNFLSFQRSVFEQVNALEEHNGHELTDFNGWNRTECIDYRLNRGIELIAINHMGLEYRQYFLISFIQQANPEYVGIIRMGLLDGEQGYREFRAMHEESRLSRQIPNTNSESAVSGLIARQIFTALHE